MRSVNARPHVDLVRFRTARRHRRHTASSDDSTDASGSSASASSSGGGHKRSTRLGDLPTYAVQVSARAGTNLDTVRQLLRELVVEAELVAGACVRSCAIFGI